MPTTLDDNNIPDEFIVLLDRGSSPYSSNKGNVNFRNCIESCCQQYSVLSTEVDKKTFINDIFYYCMGFHFFILDQNDSSKWIKIDPEVKRDIILQFFSDAMLKLNSSSSSSPSHHRHHQQQQQQLRQLQLHQQVDPLRAKSLRIPEQKMLDLQPQKPLRPFPWEHGVESLGGYDNKINVDTQYIKCVNTDSISNSNMSTMDQLSVSVHTFSINSDSRKDMSIDNTSDSQKDMSIDELSRSIKTFSITTCSDNQNDNTTTTKMTAITTRTVSKDDFSNDVLDDAKRIVWNDIEIDSEKSASFTTVIPKDRNVVIRVNSFREMTILTAKTIVSTTNSKGTWTMSINSIPTNNDTSKLKIIFNAWHTMLLAEIATIEIEKFKKIFRRHGPVGNRYLKSFGDLSQQEF